MPCVRIRDGILCFRPAPIEVQHNGKTYLFESHPGCGLMPVNRDGSERLSRVPWCVYDKAVAKLRKVEP